MPLIDREIMIVNLFGKEYAMPGADLTKIPMTPPKNQLKQF